MDTYVFYTMYVATVRREAMRVLYAGVDCTHAEHIHYAHEYLMHRPLINRCMFSLSRSSTVGSGCVDKFTTDIILTRRH